MKKISLLSLALAGSLFVPAWGRAQYASAVLNYTRGTGFVAGFTNASAAMGAPTLTSSVTPFAPPSGKSQILSVGAGGSLTVQLNPPVVNNPSNPYGLDFIIFGNTFFTITNGNFSGGGLSSGLPGGNNPGATHVEVSADGTNWFTLNPMLAPTADGIFPTDGIGDPLVPVNPALTTNDFAGLGLPGIRALYNGSAGGSGFDLAWAQDTNGNFVNLPIARFVRVDVLSGKSELDALSEVRGSQVVVADDFVNNPLANGWKIYGNTNLFQWNPTNQNVEVTWDSAQTNSYFYLPLGTTLAVDDAFSLSFDLQLHDAVAFNYGSELSVGLFNFSNATNASFSRGGVSSPNLFEFDYFPDTGYGDSMDATLVDALGYPDYFFTYDNQTLQPGVTYSVTLTHAAGATNLTGQVFTNGVLFSSLPNAYAAPISNFRLDTLSISSYQDDGYGDSILAHGTVKNFLVTLPQPAVQHLAGYVTNGLWATAFTTRTNWVYSLERTTDLRTWTTVNPNNAGTGTNLVLLDNTPLAASAWYRVRAERP